MNSKVKIGLLHSLIRRDEKLLIDEINGRDDAELVMIDDREISFSLKKISNYGSQCHPGALYKPLQGIACLTAI